MTHKARVIYHHVYCEDEQRIPFVHFPGGLICVALPTKQNMWYGLYHIIIKPGYVDIVEHGEWLPCYSLPVGVTWYCVTNLWLDGDITWILGEFSSVEKRPKKKALHTFGNLESQKQVYLWCGVKNRRIGAAATFNNPHQRKKK